MRTFQPQFFGDHIGIKRHTITVIGGKAAFGIHHIGKGRGHVIQIILVDLDGLFRRQHRKDQIGQVRVCQLLPKPSRRLNVTKGFGQLRRKPDARAVHDLRQRITWPLGRMKHIRHLRDQRDIGVLRDRLAAQPIGSALTVPMFIQRTNAALHRLGKPHLCRDIRAAMAARFDQFLRNLAAFARHPDNGANPVAKTGLQSGLGKDEPQSGTQTAINLFEVMFETDVIRQE